MFFVADNVTIGVNVVCSFSCLRVNVWHPYGPCSSPVATVSLSTFLAGMPGLLLPTAGSQLACFPVAPLTQTRFVLPKLCHTCEAKGPVSQRGRHDCLVGAWVQRCVDLRPAGLAVT